MLTNILLIGLILIIITAIVLTFILLYKKIFPYLEKKNEIRLKEVYNKRIELFNSISLEKVDKEIDEYIQRQVARYITYKFVANRITFINSDDTELMIKDITKLIVVEASEVYTSYMKLLVSINTDEDYIRYVHNRVKNAVIETVSAFNKSEIL
jgi:hypothetical protein